MRVPWPVLAFRSPRRSRSRRARRPRPGVGGGRADAEDVPRPGRVRLRHAPRAARPHGRHAGDGRAALRGPARRPAQAPDRPVRRTGAVGRVVGLVVRDLAGSGAAPLPPRGARPARDGQVGRARVPQPAAAALAGPVHAPGGRQLREPHRAAARLLHDGRHGARHRRPAPGARRRQDRAHGDLVRHPRRAAIRPRLPRARRPLDPGLDRRPRRPRRLPARHLPQPAARARRAVRPRRLPQRDQGPGGRRGRARAPHQRERPAARRLLRRAAASRRATRYATPDELSFLLIAGDLNPFLQAALPAAISAARRGDTAPLMRLRRIGQGGADARARTCRSASTPRRAAPT